MLFKLDLCQWRSTLTQIEHAFVPDIYFLIAVLCKFSYILSQSFWSVKAKVLCILKCKYAFKKLTLVCLAWFSVQLFQFMWFLRFIVWTVYMVSVALVSSACPSHNTCILSQETKIISIIVIYWLFHYSSYYSVTYINFQTNIFG